MTSPTATAEIERLAELLTESAKALEETGLWSFAETMREAVAALRSEGRPREQEGVKAPVALDRVVIGGAEYVSYAKAVATVMDLQRKLYAADAVLRAHPAPLPADGWKEATDRADLIVREEWQEFAKTRGVAASAMIAAILNRLRGIDEYTAPTPPASTEGEPYAYLCVSPIFNTEIVYEKAYAEAQAARPERWAVYPLIKGAALQTPPASTEGGADA